MEVLWAPWRMDYIADKNKPDGCIFCMAFADPCAERLVLRADAYTVIMMNKYPYNNGHLLIAPRRHTADLSDLTAEDNAAIAVAMQKSVKSLEQLMQPGGFNLGLNLGQAAGAGIRDHLHWHVVPRWVGDSNFMSVLAEVRSIPEHIETTYHKLLPYFKD